jgi:hypothetical protein
VSLALTPTMTGGGVEFAEMKPKHAVFSKVWDAILIDASGIWGHHGRVSAAEPGGSGGLAFKTLGGAKAERCLGTGQDRGLDGRRS